MSADNKETNEMTVHRHQAYDNPAVPIHKTIEFIKHSDLVNEKYMTGDPEKLVSVLFKLVDLEEVPFRVPLSKESWMMKDAKEKKTLEEEEKFKLRDWSEDLAISK